MERNEKPDTAAPAVTRKPYERPAISESADFETLALACIKTAATKFCVTMGGAANS